MNPFKYDMVPYTRGVGLECSIDEGKTFPHFIKVDLDEIRTLFKAQAMDYVYYHHDETGNEWGQDDVRYAWGLIKHGGHLNVVIKAGVSIHSLMSAVLGREMVETVRNEEWAFYAFKKLNSQDTRTLEPVQGPTCAVLRYGGIGDMMLAAGIFPMLKQAGFHVTLYTHVNSYDVVKHDPNIDRFVLQDSGQVPIDEFRDFCLHTMDKYDRFVNLSESIEGTILSLPDRVSYYWPKEVRHERSSVNYYEFTAKIAGVPKHLGGQFHMTRKEMAWAEKKVKKMGSPIILWVLSGSSVHKFWPWQDQAVARILVQHPTAQIVMVGDEASKLIQRGWEKEPRVHAMCGKWDVRETMTFCNYADVIVTPETGVALSVQFKDIPKVLLLSHSSVENCAEDWVNCVALEPEGCECYPCHKMHYGWEFCSAVEIEDETGKTARFAECQVCIDPDRVTSVINSILLKEKAA